MTKFFSSSFFIGLFTVACSTATYFFLNPEITGPLWDVAIFRYIGMLICNGGVPYVDVFDHKPPIIYFFYALGHSISYKWGVFILFLLLNIFTSILIFSLFKKKQLVLGYSLCLLLNAVVLFCSHKIAYIDIFTTRYLVMYLILIFCAFSILQKNSYAIHFTTGLFLAIILLLQTNEVLPAFVFACFILFYKKLFPQKLRALAWVFFGAITVVLPITIYLYYNNALSEFFYQAFRFNFETYVPIHEDTLLNKFKSTYASMIVLNLHYILYAIGVLGALLFFVKRNISSVIIFLFMGITFLVQFYTTGLSNNNYGHYFFPFIGYALAFMMVFSKEGLFDGSLLISKLKLLLSITAFIVCIGYVIIENKPFEKFKEKQFENAFSEIEKSISFEKIKNTKGTFFSWEVGNYITLNAKYNIIAPTKWVYSNGLIAPYFISNGIDETIMNNITTHQTKYVLTYQLPNLHNRRTFLEQNYTHVFYENEGINIWQKQQ